jgi:hypothetical protein
MGIGAGKPDAGRSAHFQRVLLQEPHPYWLRDYEVTWGLKGVDNSVWYAGSNGNPIHAWILEASPRLTDDLAFATEQLWHALDRTGAMPTFLNRRDPRSGLTPFMRACECKHTWTYLRIMRSSPWFAHIDVNLSSSPTLGGTALHRGLSFVFPSAELRRGADHWIAIAARMTPTALDAVDSHGMTILRLAFHHRIFPLCKFLLEGRPCDTDVFARDAWGRTILDAVEAELWPLERGFWRHELENMLVSVKGAMRAQHARVSTHLARHFSPDLARVVAAYSHPVPA